MLESTINVPGEYFSTFFALVFTRCVHEVLRIESEWNHPGKLNERVLWVKGGKSVLYAKIFAEDKERYACYLTHLEKRVFIEIMYVKDFKFSMKEEY